MAKAIRSHWGIENRLYWLLDVIFKEDHSHIRRGHEPPEQVFLVPKHAHEPEAPTSGIKEAGASTTGVSMLELGNEDQQR